MSIIDQPAVARLSLVGVGPGDPELLTLAAVRAIEQADVIACPVARTNGESMAMQIARRWVRANQRVLPVLFPMIQDAEPRRQAWNAAADALAALVAEGQTVVLLCEGDASLFATGSYVLMALRQRHPLCPYNVIAGVTSISAAAAAAAWPLALQLDQFLVMPCPDDLQQLEAVLDRAAMQSRVLALLKLGRRWRWVRPLLERRQLLEDALFAERVGWPDQTLCQACDVVEGERSYFSLLLIRQDWPNVLP